MLELRENARREIWAFRQVTRERIETTRDDLSLIKNMLCSPNLLSRLVYSRAIHF